MQVLLEQIGHEVARTMGREGFVVLGSGLDGVAFALEDGDVLKLTKSSSEAAVAQMLQEGTLAAPDVFPAVHAVAVVDLSDGETAYAILKADAHEVFEDPDDEQKSFGIPIWRAAFSLAMSMGWLRDRSDIPDLRLLVEGLKRLDRTGIIPGDLPPSNAGISRGRLC